MSKPYCRVDYDDVSGETILTKIIPQYKPTPIKRAQTYKPAGFPRPTQSGIIVSSTSGRPPYWLKAIAPQEVVQCSGCSHKFACLLMPDAKVTYRKIPSAV